eukprot:268493_1
MPTPRSMSMKKERNIAVTRLRKTPMYESSTKKYIYLNWCLESKKELIKTAKNNLNKRITKFLSVTRHSNTQLKDFTISNAEITKIITGCCHAISSWNGVDIDACKQQKTSYKQYRITAINWFNRNKAKIFANYLFFPIIFNHLLNFIHDIKIENSNYTTDQMKMCLFVETLLVIFDENINFARTKSQPLIPFQSLIQPNCFKSECKNFIQFYGIKWDQKHIIPAKINRIYQKDKTRSKKIYDTFITSLNNLKQLFISKHLPSVNFYSLNKNLLSISNNISIKNDQNINSNSNHQMSLSECNDISTTNNIGNFSRNVKDQNVYNTNVSNQIGNVNVSHNLSLQTQLTQQSLLQNQNINNLNFNSVNLNQMFSQNIVPNNPMINYGDGNNQFNNNTNNEQLNQLILVPIGNINNMNNQNGVLQYQLVSIPGLPSILIQQYHQLTPNI